jgi:hypothetical protein
MPADGTGIPSSPIVSLLSLGCGWTFDDIEEATAISKEVHHVFFHIFVKFGAECLYRMWVNAPTTQAEVEEHVHEMRMAGMNGCVGSTAATHIVWHRCSYRHWQLHLGYKMSQMAQSYSLTMNHCRRILSSTSGHPARWNDKTLVVLYDDFARGIHEGKCLSEVEFVLLERDSTGNIVERKYKGVWQLVNNGYLLWSTMIPPFKTMVNQRETCWSQWMELMRKHVESTFGI